MRFPDLLRLAVGALWQQKTRSVLTLIGVTIAAVLMLVSLSVGQGVRDLIDRRFSLGGQFRQIVVRANQSQRAADVAEVVGEMSDARRERLRQAEARNFALRSYDPQTPLTAERLDALSRLPHVERVQPRIQEHWRLVLGDRAETGFSAGLPADSESLRERLLVGEAFDADDAQCALVSESLAYRWGFRDEQDVPQILGKILRLESSRGGESLGYALALRSGRTDVDISTDDARALERLLERLPPLLEQLDLPAEQRDLLAKLLQPPRAEEPPEMSPAAEFRICGVFRYPTREEDQSPHAFVIDPGSADVILPLATARQLALREPARAAYGFDAALVTVTRDAHVKDVVQQIEAMGLDQWSMVEWVENLRANTALISYAMAAVAGVALLVAALGITNTMAMSVLERTREIGIMKALGARESWIQAVFLIEGALLGLIGGGLGLLGGWLASLPGDRIAHDIIEREYHQRIDDPVFSFPVWLVVGVPLFATLVTTLAGVWPARRAARIDAVAALRHE